MEKNKLKSISLIIIIIGLFVAVILLYSKISELNSRIENLQTDFYNTVNNMQEDINGIYDNVDKRLKKQASILTGYDITYGQLDVNSYTAPLFVSVTPKNSDSTTTVSVTIGEASAELNRNGEVFSGYIDTDVFIKETAYPLITVKTNNSVQNEYLEDYDMKGLFTDYMPYLYSDMTVTEETFSNNKLMFSGELHIDYKPSSEKDTTTFTQFWLVGESDGNEVFRNDITQKVEQANGKTVLIEKTYNSEEYDDMQYYIIATDSLGFTHKNRVNCIYVGGDNTENNTVQVDDGFDCIYNKNGKLLYGNE